MSLLETTHPEGLGLRSLEDVQETVDCRLGTASRPSAEELDKGLTRQISDAIRPHHHHTTHDPEKQESTEVSEGPSESEPIYVRAGYQKPRSLQSIEIRPT